MRLRLLVGLLASWLLLTACTPVQRGHYTWGHEVNTIQRCDTNEIYWVRCERLLADRLRTFVEKHTDHPYTAVYVEFRGHLLDEKPDGFAADYDGIFYLEKVLLMKAAVSENCPVPSNERFNNEQVPASPSQ